MFLVSRSRGMILRSACCRHRSVISEDFIVRSPFTDLEIERKTVPERVFEFSSRWPEKTALVCGATGRSLSYGALERRSRTLAANLRTRLAIQDGDRVAVLLPNCPEYATISLGAMMAGATVALVNPAYKAAEVEHHFAIAQPKLILVSPECYATVRETLNAMQATTPVMVVDQGGAAPQGAIKYSEFAEAENVDLSCLKTVRITPDNTALLPFSSGTTGLPKAVDLPHTALVASSYVCSHPDYVMQQPTTADHQDVVPAILPFFHIYGHVSVMLNNLFHGCCIVTMPQFSPELFLKVLAEHKSTLMYAVPPIIQFLAKHPHVKAEYLEATRLAICGGACLPPAEVEIFEAKVKNTELLLAYGLTETTALGCATARGNRSQRRPDSCGTPFVNMTMKVTDIDTEKNLGPNQQGELWVEGMPVMRGYYGNPEQTRAVLTEDGWLRTGDVGYYDENGHFYVTERLKELIKVKGFQVAPAELEGVLLSHPAILDAGVVGVERRDGASEEPVGFVVLRPGAKVSAEELVAFVAERVTAYKRLAAVNVLESIPKNNTGKILRRELKRLLHSRE